MPEPVGYEKSHEKPCSRVDCVIGVGFDTDGRGNITRFLVDLQYTCASFPLNYTQIARFDHNPTAPNGHDIRTEGLHVDVVRKDVRDVKAIPRHSHVPHDLGVVITACANYFDQHATTFVEVYVGDQTPSNLPEWP